LLEKGRENGSVAVNNPALRLSGTVHVAGLATERRGPTTSNIPSLRRRAPVKMFDRRSLARETTCEKKTVVLNLSFEVVR